MGDIMDEESNESTGEEVTGAGNSQSDSEIAKRGVDSTDKVKHANRYTRLYRYAYRSVRDDVLRRYSRKTCTLLS